MKSSDRNSPVEKNAEALISNISQLMLEAEEMLNESTSHHAEEKIALLRSGNGGRDRRLVEKYISAKESVASFARQTDRAIRACPYEAVAVALGVGVIVGVTLGRRSD